MNDKTRNMLSLILFGIGAIFVISPFTLYWFIHDSYDRYIWIINGPFQLGMYSAFFFIGVLLLIAAFGIWKQKKIVSTIAFACIIIIVALGATSLSSFIRLYSMKNITPAPTIDSTEFKAKIQSFVIENFGQPIEGFSAPIYLQAFPGLTEADFDGVETYEGRYAYSGGKLVFVQNYTGYISTAAEAISKESYGTLFSNVRNRLGSNLSLDEIINGITAWKTYISGEYEFKIKYPRNYSVLKKDDMLPDYIAMFDYIANEFRGVKTESLDEITFIDSKDADAYRNDETHNGDGNNI